MNIYRKPWYQKSALKRAGAKKGSVLHRIGAVWTDLEKRKLVNRFRRNVPLETLCDVCVCTPRQLKSLSTQSYQRVIIDIRLPKLGTKLIEQLREKCEGRVILIVTTTLMFEELPSLAYVTGAGNLQFQSIHIGEL